MPTYEYACKSCGEHLEVVQSFSDDALTTCPSCEGDLRKVFSAAGIIFKGSGWHIKDYKSSGGADPGPSDSTSSKSDNGSSSESSPKKDSGAKDSGSKKESGAKKESSSKSSSDTKSSSSSSSSTDS